MHGNEELSGTGGVGTLRPGRAGTTEPVPAGSLSSGCKATACKVDSRRCSQRSTGTTNPNMVMNHGKNVKNLPAQGNLESPGRWGGNAAGSLRIFMADNRRGEQAEGQACSSANTTGARTWYVRREAAEPTHRSSSVRETPARRQPRQPEGQEPREESVPGHQLRPRSQVQRKGVTRNTRRASQCSELLPLPHLSQKATYGRGADSGDAQRAVR